MGRDLRLPSGKNYRVPDLTAVLPNGHLLIVEVETAYSAESSSGIEQDQDFHFIAQHTPNVVYVQYVIPE